MPSNLSNSKAESNYYISQQIRSAHVSTNSSQWSLLHTAADKALQRQQYPLKLERRQSCGAKKATMWYSKLVALARQCLPHKIASPAPCNATDEEEIIHLTKASWPIFPPPRPQLILQDRQHYRSTVVKPRRFAAPRGEFKDQSLYALYRLYEWFLLDHVTGYRNDLELFWRHSDWVIEQIPDPADDDPSRYAFLAGVVHFLVTSFNAKISYGASRKAPAIMTEEYAEALKAVPHSERAWEKMPAWASNVPKLQETLSIPTVDGTTMDGLDDPRADNFLKSKNILLWTPHIHFT